MQGHLLLQALTTLKKYNRSSTKKKILPTLKKHPPSVARVTFLHKQHFNA